MKWHESRCQTCGQPVDWKWNEGSLQQVEISGDETLATRIFRTPPLFAEAPEMLGALERAVNAVETEVHGQPNPEDMVPGWYWDAIKIIRKAKGCEK